MKIYTVGQVLFLIANNKIVPIQVIEEIVRTTLEGTDKSYIVLFPDKDKSTADIKNVKGKIFADQESVRKHMTENATNAINSMIKDANEICKLAFNVEKESKEVLEALPIIEEQKMQPESNNNIITVDLGAGKVGKISQANLEQIGEV